MSLSFMDNVSINVSRYFDPVSAYPNVRALVHLKHTGGNAMLWRCLSAGPGTLIKVGG